MTGEINLINAIPLHYRILAIGALAASTYGLGWLKGAHHAELKAAKFEAATVALGKAQAERNKTINARNLQLKEQADHAYAKSEKDLADLYATYRRVLNRPGGSTVSGLPTNASDPSRICFNRAKFADAVGIIEAGVPAITEQGDRGIAGLNVAKKWGQTK